MHPIPLEADFQFLIGLEVSQVCLDPWSTQIRFEGGGQISIEGAFEHVDSSGASHPHQVGDDQDRGPVFLRELIQQPVVGVDGSETMLTLRFANGSKLRIGSEVGVYETAVIQPPNSELKPIVF